MMSLCQSHSTNKIYIKKEKEKVFLLSRLTVFLLDDLTGLFDTLVFRRNKKKEGKSISSLREI